MATDAFQMYWFIFFFFKLADQIPTGFSHGDYLIGFYKALLRVPYIAMSFTEFYRVLLGFTGFYWAILGFTGFEWVLLGYYQVLLGFTEFLPALIGFDLVFFGFTVSDGDRMSFSCPSSGKSEPFAPRSDAVATGGSEAKSKKISVEKETKNAGERKFRPSGTAPAKAGRCWR